MTTEVPTEPGVYATSLGKEGERLYGFWTASLLEKARNCEFRLHFSERFVPASEKDKEWHKGFDAAASVWRDISGNVLDSKKLQSKYNESK